MATIDACYDEVQMDQCFNIKCPDCKHVFEVPREYCQRDFDVSCPNCDLQEINPKLNLYRPRTEASQAAAEAKHVEEVPVCSLCGKPMTPKNMGVGRVILGALLIFLVGIPLIFLSLFCVGPIAGIIVIVVGILLCCSAKSILKCTGCGAIVNRVG